MNEPIEEELTDEAIVQSAVNHPQPKNLEEPELDNKEEGKVSAGVK